MGTVQIDIPLIELIGWAAAELGKTLQEISTRALKSYQTAGNVVQGGDSFNNPPTLQPGQYQDDIKVNETLYYGINLQEGQRLRVTGTFVGQPDVGFTEGAALNAQVILYDPLRQTIGIPQTAIGFGKETASAALETKPVGRAGLYYVALSLKDMMNSTSGRVFKTEIIVEVLSGS